MKDIVWPWLWCLVVVLGISGLTISAQPSASSPNTPPTFEGASVSVILQRLGAKLERGTSRHALEEYLRHFHRADVDRDGKYTRKEYVERGRYLTRQARSGIFRAADENRDDIVTQAEFVLNRIITDEAKELVQMMDDDQDNRVEQAEFVRHTTKRLGDSKLAVRVFSMFDVNSDGVLAVPEYLRVWGQWARAGQNSAGQRIATRRTELKDAAGQPGEAQPGNVEKERPGQPGRRADSRAGSRNTRTNRFTPFGRPGSRFGGSPPNPEQFVERALQFDANKDGKLDRRELLKLAESMGGARSGRGGPGGRDTFGGRQGGRFGNRRDSSRRPGR